MLKPTSAGFLHELKNFVVWEWGVLQSSRCITMA